MRFARTQLSSAFTGVQDTETRINLAAPGRAKAYEKSTAYAKFYPADALPPEPVLLDDLSAFIQRLGQLYEAIDLGQTPDEDDPAAVDLERAIRRWSRAGQGRGLSGPERNAVECHAMDLAANHLKSLGFRVRDVSGSESFDFLAKANGKSLFVEVKGTTGSPHSILLTANEVSLHRDQYPQNALVLVHGINLVRGPNPRASGGILEYVSPWLLKTDALRPMAYTLIDPLK